MHQNPFSRISFLLERFWTIYETHSIKQLMNAWVMVLLSALWNSWIHVQGPEIGGEDRSCNSAWSSCHWYSICICSLCSGMPHTTFTNAKFSTLNPLSMFSVVNEMSYWNGKEDWGGRGQVCRDPRWGRCYESYSEDPEVVRNMTTIIDGLQGRAPAGWKGPYVQNRY